MDKRNPLHLCLAAYSMMLLPHERKPSLIDILLWKFTEASRGKAAHDGVGGALENRAHSLVARGTEIPSDAALFENLLKLTEENVAKCGGVVPPSLKSVPETKW